MTPLPNHKFTFKYEGHIYHCNPITDRPGEFVILENETDTFGEWANCWEALVGIFKDGPGKTIKEKIEHLQSNVEYKKSVYNKDMKDIIND